MLMVCLVGPAIYLLSFTEPLQRTDYQARAEHEPLVFLPFVITYRKCCGSRWKIRSSRSAGRRAAVLPANFMLVAAMNPCPCGYLGDPEHACTCSPMFISRYQKRLSGPLLDRIDIHVEVPRVPFQKLSDERRGEPSAAIRARVEAARARQSARFANAKDGQGASLTTNADMGPTQVRDHCPVDETGRQPSCSARPCGRCSSAPAPAFGDRNLKLGRTIADLAEDCHHGALAETGGVPLSDDHAARLSRTRLIMPTGRRSSAASPARQQAERAGSQDGKHPCGQRKRPPRYCGTRSRHVSFRESRGLQTIDIEGGKSHLSALRKKLQARAGGIREDLLREHHLAVVPEHLDRGTIHEDVQAHGIVDGAHLGDVNTCEARFEGCLPRLGPIHEQRGVFRGIADGRLLARAGPHVKADATGGGILPELKVRHDFQRLARHIGQQIHTGRNRTVRMMFPAATAIIQCPAPPPSSYQKTLGSRKFLMFFGGSITGLAPCLIHVRPRSVL